MTVPPPAAGGEPAPSAGRGYPVSFAVFAVARAHRGLAGAMLADLGLFPGQELIIMQLAVRDGRSQKELVEALRLDHSTIAKSLRRMEAAGLVTRVTSPEDARVKLVSLTPAGRALESRIEQVWTELERLSTQALSEREQAQFVKLAHELAASLPPGGPLGD
ncbi:MarR family transcriptional regulator [Kineococcus sp. NUM-3379]